MAADKREEGGGGLAAEDEALLAVQAVQVVGLSAKAKSPTWLSVSLW